MSAAASNSSLPDKQAAIVVDHAVKRYGAFEAVKDVSFSVADGEIFGLLGPNGAGKSTLIRMMTTLIPLTGGHAIIAGHDVNEVKYANQYAEAGGLARAWQMRGRKSVGID